MFQVECHLLLPSQNDGCNIETRQESASNSYTIPAGENVCLPGKVRVHMCVVQSKLCTFSLFKVSFFSPFFILFFLPRSCSVANPISVLGCLLERMEMDGKRRHQTSKSIMTSKKFWERKFYTVNLVLLSG